MGGRSDSQVYGDVVDSMVLQAQADPRLRALWIEGATQAELRRPYRRLEMHLAADEPDFPAVERELERMLARAGALSGMAWADVPRFARELRGALDGAPLSVVLEKTSLLAKRPRAAVVALMDRSGRLLQVMDFSRPRPGAMPRRP